MYIGRKPKCIDQPSLAAQPECCNEMIKKFDWLISVQEPRLGSCMFDFPNLLGHKLVSVKIFPLYHKPMPSIKKTFLWESHEWDLSVTCSFMGQMQSYYSSWKGHKGLLWLWAMPTAGWCSGWVKPHPNFWGIMEMDLIILAENRRKLFLGSGEFQTVGNGLHSAQPSMV